MRATGGKRPNPEVPKSGDWEDTTLQISAFSYLLS